MDDNVLLLDETTGFESYKLQAKDKIPSDFKPLVIDVIDAAEKVAERKVGEGVADAAFGRLKILFSDAKDRISRKEVKRTYSIIIPKFALSVPFLTPKKYHKWAEEILTSVGFKKGQRIGSEKYSNYYYKKSKDKNSLFVAYYSSPVTNSGLNPVATQMQLYVYCAINDEKTKSIVENANSGIFESVQFI